MRGGRIYARPCVLCALCDGPRHIVWVRTAHTLYTVLRIIPLLRKTSFLLYAVPVVVVVATALSYGYATCY